MRKVFRRFSYLYNRYYRLQIYGFIRIFEMVDQARLFENQ